MHLVTYLHPRLPTDSAEEPNIFATFFIGLILERMVRVHQASRNLPAQAGEL